MHVKSVIFMIVSVVLCIKLGQGLQCYEHGLCLGDGCEGASMRNVTCDSGHNRCWKLKIPKGTQRGCGDDKCKVQLDTPILETANVCCATDLCNSANQRKFSIIMVLCIAFSALLH